jgi:cytidylate kinase
LTPRVVTVSASYGAGGSFLGPAVARRLGLEFFDRAIPAAVARKLSVPIAEARERDEHTPGAFARALAAMSHTVAEFGDPLTSAGGGADAEQQFRTETERVLRSIAEHSGGVILGRAAAIVLADHPGALHVRLSGPRDRRLARAMEMGQLSREHATRRLDDTDRARTEYVKHFYRTDPRDPTLYHLTIDTTALPDATVVELIVRAAQARSDTPHA